MIGRVLRDQREIALVLALFVALGMFYSTTTPLFEAPDEQLHFAFVQSIATGRGLPVQTLDHPTHLAQQEGSQPPLYYLLAAASTFWIDTSDYPGIVWQNPHYGYNVPGIVDDNKNLFIHTALENFPYHGAALAIHLARLLSVLMGALAVLFTFLLTLEIFPGRKLLAAGAAALIAFVPQFIFISSAVSNDSTIVAMAALSLWLMVRLVTHDQRDAHDEESRNPILAEWWPIAALGATTGLASLAKVSGLGLVVLAALVLVYVSLKRGDNHLETSTTPGPGPGLLIFRLVVFGAAVVLVAGWWYLRNLNLYGELTGTAMMVRIFGARTTPLTTDQLLTQLREVWETFWVGFGWGNIRAQPWVYTTLEILVAASGIGLLLGLARRREHIRETLVRAAPLFVLALWIVIAFVELLNWMEMTQAPHGRLFFPALPALGPLAVFGLTQLFPRRAQTLVLRGAAVGQLAFAALASVLILEPAYAFPAFASQAPAVSQPVKVNFDNKMELLGYDVSPNRTRPGEAVTLTLYWQSLAAMDEDYSIGIHLVDSGGRAIGARDSYPGHGLLPTRLWQPGQILRDPYWLPVSGDAIPSSIGRIEVSLYSLSDRRALPAFDPAGNSLATPVVGRLKISGTGTPAVIPRSGQAYSFGKTIDLLGEDIQTTRAGENGQNVSLTLYWKRAAPVELDYAVFVHILDAKGKIVTQKDQEPAGGEDPTSLWDENEIVPDRYAFALPSGDYTIELGLYNAQSGERLPVTDARENPLGDHITFPLGVKP